MHRREVWVYAPGEELSLASLKRQTVMENAVRECERLPPPLILLVRKVLKPLRFGDCDVPAETAVR